LLYPAGLPLLYGFIGEKAEIYGTKEDINFCYEHSVSRLRFNYLRDKGNLPAGVTQQNINGSDY